MGTSMTLTNIQRIGFRPLDHRRDSVDREDGGLFFTEEEFNNAAASYMDYRSQDVKFRIDDSALEYIKGLSCGHPGVSGATFQILWSYWHDKSRWGSRHLPITCAEARNIFEDRVRVSKEFTDLTPVNRGFFKLEDVTADVEKEFEGEYAVSKIKDFLRKIIHKGSFSLSEANETEESLMRILYHRGIVQAELAPKSNDEVEEVIYVFPTLLHQRHYEYLTSEELYPLDKPQVSSLEDLLKQCLTNFKSQALTNSRRHQDLLGFAGVRRPIEAIYQSELYRTLDKVLKGAYAQSDWCGPGHSQGRIDFRVIIPRPDNEATEFYGIECVRDGDRMRSHVDRFLEKGSQEDTEEGAYYQWTKDGSLTAFALVDFTTNENDPLRRDFLPNYPWIYYVVFSSDFSSFWLKDHKGSRLYHGCLLNSR